MTRLVLLVGLLFLVANPMQASETRLGLISDIVAAGTHEHEHRLHTVTIEDCVLTTFVYEDWGEHSKVLWSSFRVHIRALSFQDPNKDGDRFVWAEDFNQEDHTLAVIPISVRAPGTARHEIAMRRTPPEPYTPSPREGLDSYVYKERSSFVIIHVGLASKEKPRRFIDLLERYRMEYCIQLG